MPKAIMPAAAALLIGVLALAVWMWPTQKQDLSPPAQSQITNHKSQIPTPVDILTSGRAGEDIGAAIDIAAQIARENRTLTPAEATRILNFISSEKPPSLTDGDWQHLVNNLLNALRTNPTEPVKQRLTSVLSDIAKNHPDSVLRLYALQHISFWYPHEPDPAKKQSLVQLLQTLSSSGNEAGTATMVISDLQRSGNLPTDPQTTAAITHAARRLASDPTAPTDTRVSAVHTLSDRQATTSLPALRKIAADTTERIILRKAAIFTIGRLGNPNDDLPLLKRLSKEHPRLAQAAKPALKKLQN